MRSFYAIKHGDYAVSLPGVFISHPDSIARCFAILKYAESVREAIEAADTSAMPSEDYNQTFQTAFKAANVAVIDKVDRLFAHEFCWSIDSIINNYRAALDKPCCDTDSKHLLDYLNESYAKRKAILSPYQDAINWLGGLLSSQQCKIFCAGGVKLEKGCL